VGFHFIQDEEEEEWGLNGGSIYDSLGLDLRGRELHGAIRDFKAQAGRGAGPCSFSQPASTGTTGGLCRPGTSARPQAVSSLLDRKRSAPIAHLLGAPGTGKTTLASIIARSTRSRFVAFSAVLSGVKEIRQVVQEAEEHKALGRRTILFVDEIHRFNKAQQDAFLPHVERGTIILIGATTENPSFEVNSALLSRCKVLTLRNLTEAEIGRILVRALSDETRGLGKWKVELAPEAEKFLTEMAHGDARVALNALEAAAVTAMPIRGDCGSFLSFWWRRPCSARRSSMTKRERSTTM